MRNMENIINEAVEDLDPQDDHLINARDILNQIKDAEQMIADLQMRLAHLREQLMAELGSEIRKRQPKMSIGLDNGRCRAGYRSMALDIKPDIEQGVWQIEGGPVARRFVKKFPHVTRMGGGVSSLADAIADYFNSNYKSLGR